MTRYVSKPSFDKHRREKRKKKREEKLTKGPEGSSPTAVERARQKAEWKPKRER